MTDAERAALEAHLCATTAQWHRAADEMIELAHLLHRLSGHAPLLADMLATITTQCATYRELLGADVMGEAS